ncbi:TSUP family transporter [Streptomyces sp. NPDC090106]|uniref:TSUP family transporter n=1 Tax=Streptomyces sp. NPDC090106 TaxID=3365946 RepID=UPI0038065EE4
MSGLVMAGAVASGVVAGAVAQSATGVGFGLLAGPCLLLAAPAAGPLPVLVAGAAVLGVTLKENRAGWRGRVVLRIVLAALPGALLGTALLRVADPRTLHALVGAVVAVSGVLGLCGWRPAASPRKLAFASLLGGMLNSLAAMPGPPLALAYRPEDTAQFRANLSGAFLAMTAVSLTATVLSRPPSHGELTLALAVSVTALAGQLAGRRWARRLPAPAVRTGAVSLSILAGVVLFVRSVTG